MRDWDALNWLCFWLIAFGFLAFGFATYQMNEHEKFLREHGCQLLTEAETGRRVYCGKACFRSEYVYVYECADGTRTEVD